MHTYTHPEKKDFFKKNVLQPKYLNREKENLSYHHVQAGQELSLGDGFSVVDEARLHHRQDMFFTLM